MIIVTNKMKTIKGYAEKMADRFTKAGPLQEMQGFHKVEVTVTEKQECDILNVSMYWESHEDFQAWRDSDIFKRAHQGSENKNASESPIIDSEIIISKVVSTLKSIQ
ncbi:heme oxygenase [Oceanobacillus senegalensis]|uniref:heme oxygenase n=1 Tax=Oceanobacillus senegalensis TaxID=1936063 RepID=UPI000A30F122|nr:heme oxygenase [Oceanobacillus senegalensis]